MTAVIAFAVLIRISPAMTGIAFAFLLVFGLGLRKAFQRHSSDLSRARQDQRRGHRPPHGISGRGTGGEGLPCRGAGADVFSSGVERLLQNVFKTLTATSVMSLSASTLMGLIGAIVMFMGTRQILAGS